MRVTALARPAPALCAAPRLRPRLPASRWAGAVSRLPRPALAARPGLPPLDAGFFFPSTPTPTPGLRTFRRLRLSLSHGRRPRAPVLRALGMWEVLGGSRLGTPRPLPRGLGPAGALLRGPNFAAGLRRTLGGVRVSPPRRRRRRLRAYRCLRRPRFAYRLRAPSPAPRPAVGLSESLLRPAFRPRARRGQARALVPALLGAPDSPRAGRDQWAAPSAGPRSHYGRPIPQVRYRPGLARAWRLLRLQFCLAWGLPWARQRRLTRFITQLRGVTGLSFIQMCLGGLGALLKESGLGQPGALGQGAWVNGRLTRNPFFQLYKGDRVSLGLAAGTHPRRDLLWAAPLATAPSPAWEVDGLTRAVTIVAELGLGTGGRPQTSLPLPFLTFRMYNWKYRH